MNAVLAEAEEFTCGKFVTTQLVVTDRYELSAWHKTVEAYDKQEARGESLRTCLNQVLRKFKGSFKILSPNLGRPQLEIGRTKPDVRKSASDLNFSVSYELGDWKLYHKLLQALSEFASSYRRKNNKTITFSSPPKPPYEIYTDASYSADLGSGIGVVIIGADANAKMYAKDISAETSTQAEFIALQEVFNYFASRNRYTDESVYYGDLNKLQIAFSNNGRTVSNEALSETELECRYEGHKMQNITFEQIDRNDNYLADQLARIGRDETVNLGVDVKDNKTQQSTKYKYAIQ